MLPDRANDDGRGPFGAEGTDTSSPIFAMLIGCVPSRLRPFAISSVLSVMPI